MNRARSSPGPLIRAGAATLALWLVVLPSCWLAMMAVHELGHVLHAFLTGGQVERVVLHPLAFSRTDLASNPHPACVAWGGPIWGVLAPLGLWAIPPLRRSRLGPLLRFFAGFGLLANGAYLGAAVIEPVGDAADLLRLGTPRWVPALFGLAAGGGGLALWNGLGPALGLKGQRPDPLLLPVSAAALAGMLALTLLRG